METGVEGMGAEEERARSAAGLCVGGRGNETKMLGIEIDNRFYSLSVLCFVGYVSFIFSSLPCVYRSL